LIGFVEYLVQELECKIIIIYNENYLVENDEASKKVLDTYREKVIDREFTFNPTLEEKLDMLLKENPDVELIKEVFHRTRTNNIRIIRKTCWLIDELIPLIKNWEPSLRNQIITNSIILNVAKFDTEFQKHFPIEPDTIPSLIDSSIYKDKMPNEIMHIASKIESLKYSPIEQLDRLIFGAIQISSTITIQSEFIKQGEIRNQQEIKDRIIKKSDDALKDIYELYYNSFADNTEEISNRINTFLNENYLNLDIFQLDKTKSFLSLITEEDIPEYEKALLRNKIDLNLELYSRDLATFQDTLCKYPDLKIFLHEKQTEYRQTLDITTALSRIKGGYNSKLPWWFDENIHHKFLNDCTFQEYVQWLEQEHKDLYSMIQQCLNLHSFASESLKQAICLLAKKNKLNKIRAKFLYEIDIDQ